MQRKPILIEIVSASLPQPSVSLEESSSTSTRPPVPPSPYVTVHRSGCAKAVHRTKTIKKRWDPIWTVKTDGLYLLRCGPDDDGRDEGNDGHKCKLAFEVRDGEGARSRLLGRIVVEYDTLEGCGGDRMEFDLTMGKVEGVVDGAPEEKEEEETVSQCRSLIEEVEDNDDKVASTRGTLVLRSRLATDYDVQFMDDLHVRSTGGTSRLFSRWQPLAPVENTSTSSDVNLRHITRGVSGTTKKWMKADDGNGKVLKYRVKPYPDPKDIAATTWMTPDELECDCRSPSKHWSDVGSGTVGDLHVEILECRDLPNMDMDLDRTNVTDAIAVLQFEDSVVRTDVIFDELNPTWPSWSTRAFKFRIEHPSSLLHLGVLDYDDGGLGGQLNYHDPIGRVVLEPLEFKSGMVYDLIFNLHDHPHNCDSRGTIRIRLRVQWHNFSSALKLSLTPPPRWHINVDNDKSYRVLQYLTRGSVDMNKSSLATVKLLGTEFWSYKDAVFYGIDVLIGVILWRGQLHFSVPHFWWVKPSSPTEVEGEVNQSNHDTAAEANKRRIEIRLWFPIHSILLFHGSVVAVEHPSLLPSLLFFGIAYTMCVMNYSGSRDPDPWRRCRSIHELNTALLFGSRYQPRPVTVQPNERLEEAHAYHAMKEARTRRVGAFLSAIKTAGLKLRRQNKSAEMTNIEIATEGKEWSFWGPKLYYVHLMLSMMCAEMRSLRDLFNWKTYGAHKLTMTCLMAGTVCLFLPLNHILLWSSRIFVWGVLGPWFKLVDIFWVHPHYRTVEELLADPNIDPIDVDSLARIATAKNLARRMRIAAEDALKLKDMREHKFGKFSERIPTSNASRFPSIPLPQSSAAPYYPKKSNLTSKPRDINGAPTSDDVQWSSVSGQRLHGPMVPTIAGR